MSTHAAQRPTFPLFLGIWSFLIFALLLFLHWFSNAPPPQPTTPPTCARWIGLAFLQQQIVLCLPTDPKEAQPFLATYLRPLKKRCTLPPLPIPQHGQLLHLSIPSRSSTSVPASHRVHPTSTAHTAIPYCHAHLSMLPAPQRILLGIPLPLNHATASELTAIPRISQRLATAIVARRTQKGPFTRLEQLRDIRGIGPKTLQRVRPHLTLQSPPPLPTTRSAAP
ncbi:helix-hairpin-helix domain-containing protein [Myxococcota bacterium]|nr:helix-hairpin-helix domain-containing protein [Myxococcota bacterium]